MTVQPYEAAILFVMGMLIGAGLLKVYQRLKADGVFGTLPAASLPSTENIEACLSPSGHLSVRPAKPKKQPGEVYCPGCGVLAKKLPTTGDTVRDMNFQYHCNQCQREVFGGR